MEEQNEITLENKGELKIEDLIYVQAGRATEEECGKLDGCRVKIATCIRELGRSFWDNGQKLPEGQEVEIQQLKLTTEPFGKDIIGRDITIKEKYNLQFKDGIWVVSLAEKAKTAKFLAKYKLDTFANVEGIEVVIVKQVNPKTKVARLSISI